MDLVARDDLARIGRIIVADIAPEELVLYRPCAEAFLRDPAKLVSRRKPREDAMGFGAGEVGALLTPFVLLAVNEVIKGTAQQIGKKLGDAVSALVPRAVQRLFDPVADSDRLTDAELTEIRAVAVANAGPDPAMANRIADGIVAALRKRHGVG